MTCFISVIRVLPLDNYNLLLQFNNGEEKKFDMSPYLETGIFQRLKDKSLFKACVLEHDTVTWLNGKIDMSPDTLYLKSIKA
jgi:hypothetical protein